MIPPALFSSLCSHARPRARRWYASRSLFSAFLPLRRFPASLLFFLSSLPPSPFSSFFPSLSPSFSPPLSSFSPPLSSFSPPLSSFPSLLSPLFSPFSPLHHPPLLTTPTTRTYPTARLAQSDRASDSYHLGGI
ncbi:hypothetical protein FA13DRAFT_350574 [Coprinellus micaceus]|uniref:Uncharacterized protein n=1 Tax=Coprinellus micaceus TaxID=71717 RepID=A0A4Y7SEP1_COPMI|nr:hypothetical protein FA13DRAFT_350574 [Coprinellus micaceus]